MHFFSIRIFLERSWSLSSNSEFCDSENKIEENKMMREGMGRGPHTLKQDRGTRCQTDAGVRHYQADCTLLQSEESWEVFKHFQPQHPFFKQNLARKPNLQNRQKEVGKRGEGKGQPWLSKTWKRLWERFCEIFKSPQWTVWKIPESNQLILQMGKLRPAGKRIAEAFQLVVTLLGPESKTLRLWWPGLCSSHCLGKCGEGTFCPHSPQHSVFPEIHTWGLPPVL